ncbi:MAG: hypothetical protein HYU67_13565 [Flavobacteriia bacterium]|nr:hypothetical protein [Flavobacteriia bacterium]
MRSIWGAKAIAISVRTEYLYLDKNYEKESDKSFKYKQKLKQIIFLLIKHFSLTKVYSIHKNTKYDKLVLHYTHGNFYDIQLWDLKYLNFKESMPKELINLKLDLDNYVLLAGKLDERRSKSEFIKFIKNNSDIKFIIAGIIDDNDINILKDKPNLILINRFISNEELFFLMKYCKSIYSYYSNYRPSGFFGRSVQLNRQIIVKNNSFLSENFKEYKKLISISNLSELNADLLCMPMSHDESFIYDDYNFFSKLILLL